MTSEQQALWQRLTAHVFDDPASVLPFSLRLAKENAWSLAFTRRALEEYRRFAFLAVAAGHPVSPPDAVDQVWHLHLLYTRDYWGEFCPKTLGTSLHHGPTRGGTGEGAKFADWYARTLASYRQFFGEPPIDLWPAHPAHPRAVRVDRDTHWIVRKPQLWRRTHVRQTPAVNPVINTATPQAIPGRSLTTATTVALGIVALWPQRAAAAVSPFEMKGPEFLNFFTIFGVAMFLLAFFWRWYALRTPTAAIDTPTLDPYETAQLADGPERVFETVLASLCHRGLIAFKQRELVRLDTPAPDDLPLLERVVLAAITTEGVSQRIARAAAEPALEANSATLVAHGLLVGPGQMASTWLVPLLFASSVPALGVIKIFVGLSRDKPVMFLVFLTIITVGATLAFFGRHQRLTARGSALLERMREEYAALNSLNDEALNAPDNASLLPLAVGLFGMTVLTGTAMASMQDEMRPLRKADDGDGGWFDSGSSDSSSSSGGDGGGGGGDGGSGCGGCGGGGD